MNTIKDKLNRGKHVTQETAYETKHRVKEQAYPAKHRVKEFLQRFKHKGQETQQAVQNPPVVKRNPMQLARSKLILWKEKAKEKLRRWLVYDHVMQFFKHK